MIRHPRLERVQVRSHAITDATGLFCGLSGLRKVQIDTASIEIFDRFFQSCSALTSIPPLDTSSGWNFSHMFQGCSALRQLPPLDTSNGTDFSGMFAWLLDYGGCLAYIPPLDTSQGKSFSAMFMGCSLRQLPVLNLSCLRGSIDFCYSPAIRRIEVSGLGEGLSAGDDENNWIMVNLEGTSLDAAALNAFYSALAPVNNRCTIYVSGTPGSIDPAHQPELANAKGWLVYY